jgi:UDP-MurNAc hydroxylase
MIRSLMKITTLGHAGLYIQTRAGSILCDPWVNPAYFASWFPFPDNSGLDWEAYRTPDYLYVSHLHRDHFDAEHLRHRVSRDAVVLLPAYPIDDLREALSALGFTQFVELPNGEPVERDGLRLMINALVTPVDGPIGDSALAVDDGQARVFNQNDARPLDLGVIREFGEYDAHFLQYSGAIWWPLTYELPERAKAAFGTSKRANGMARALRYVEAVGAATVVPSAGPPCFLDEPLCGYNDILGDPANPFPDQRVFLDFMREHGHKEGVLMVPGSVLDPTTGAVTHPASDERIEAIFTDKGGYLDEYARRARPVIEAERATWAAPEVDLFAELKAWFEPLLALAEHMCVGVGGPVLLRIVDDIYAEDGTPEAGPALDVVIDFPAREVRHYAGERCRYRFRLPRPVVQRLVADHEIDWVNSLFLSLRFVASRVGAYNEYVYTFFKCLSAERISYAEAWYADRDNVDERVRIDDWIVQRRCPHLRADLGQFGSITGDVLTCSMHGWSFDLPSGRCLNADGHEIAASRVDAADGERPDRDTADGADAASPAAGASAARGSS